MRSSLLSQTGLLALVGLASLALLAREDKPKALRLPGNSTVYLSAQVANLWESEPGKQIVTALGKEFQQAFLQAATERTGLSPEQIERAELVALSLKGIDQDGALILTLRKPIDGDKVLQNLLLSAKVRMIHGQKVYAESVRVGFARADGKTLVLGSMGMIEKLLDPETALPAGNLALTIEKARSHHLAGYLDPKELAEMAAKDLPAAMAPVRPLLASKSGQFWAKLGLESQLHAQMEFADDKATERGRKSLNGLRALGALSLSSLGDAYAATSKPLGAFLNKVGKVLDESEVEQKGNQVSMKLTFTIEKGELNTLIKEAILPLREMALKQQMANHFKQLGIAMHAYNDTTGTFPTATTYDKDGKALLSWRVHVLPYIEQQALYNEFKLDEPWDSAHNKKLLAKMPALYAVPGKKPAIEGGTRIQGFVGKGAFFEGKRGLGIGSFTDGLSNTFMLVEAEREVPWTKPDDLPFDPDAKMLPKLGGAFPGGFHALFGDGSVRFLKSTTKPETLKLYIQRNDGMVIPND
jgi:hypothetical protein